MIKQSRLFSLERLLFVIVTLINLIPILNKEFFFTIDGPAHLYNSRLMHYLLFGDNDVLKSFFRFNHEPVPNVTGHIIMFLSGFFFSPGLSEKILQILIIAAIPYSFRVLVKRLNPDNMFLSYIMFAFTYSYFFYNGFYNYCLSFVFLFFGISYWLKIINLKKNAARFICMFLLISLTYFSHIISFVFLLMTLTAVTFFNAFKNAHANNSYNLFSNRGFIYKIVFILLASVLPLVLIFIYLTTRSQGEEVVRISATELISWLKKLRPLISLTWEEEKYSKKIVYVIAAMSVLAIYERLNAVTFKQNIKKPFNFLLDNLRASDVWLLLIFLSTILYFKMPDVDRSASFVSARICVMIFIFLIIWLCSNDFKKWLQVTAVILVLAVHFLQNMYYDRESSKMNTTVKDITRISKYIDSNSLLLPIDVSGNWMFGHILNYAGIYKPVIILENYECSKGYFPLKWNEKLMPSVQMGNTPQSEIPCIYWKTGNNSFVKKIDYILVLGEMSQTKNPCFSKAYSLIKENYTWITNKNNLSLYKLRKTD